MRAPTLRRGSPAFRPAIAIAQNAIDVDSRKQLFIDHKFIESAEGIRLVLNPPHQTREKLVVNDQPWERDSLVASYSTVIQENGKIRMWYQISAGTPEPGKNPPMMGVAYAESTDGSWDSKWIYPVLRPARIEILEESGKRIDGFSFHESDEINANRVRQVVT